MSRSGGGPAGTLVLDSEGLVLAVRQEDRYAEWSRLAKVANLRITISAATLVEVMHPHLKRAALEWALSHMTVVPVTQQLARQASALLDVVSRHGHTHAIDAMVAATVLAAQPPVTLLTSDPDDLRLLCGDRVAVIGL